MDAYNDKPLSLPKFINMNNLSELFSFSTASFYRNQFNTNIQMVLPMGDNNNDIYISDDVFFPNEIFNNKLTSLHVHFLADSTALILRETTCLHNVVIQFKLTNADGTNFSNQRELRISLVNSAGIKYDQTVFANYQPDTGEHVTAVLNGTIIHKSDDIVKVKFILVQDNKHMSMRDTLITIFNISWNIETIKEF